MIDEPQRSRLLRMLDSHFPGGGVATLNPQERSVLANHLGRLIETTRPEKITTQMIEGVVDLYRKTWEEGFNVLR
ncbi:MAG: hypothetical protein ABW003_20365 [Microvirga sp.]|jgi:hypothetical protein